MNILHVFKTYMTDSMGGVEKTIQQLCLATTQLGVRNQIFSLTHQAQSDLSYYPEAEVYRYPISFEAASTPFSWKSMHAFAQLAKQADVVHYHFPWPFADLLHLVTQHKKPSIITYHSDIVRQEVALKFYRPLMHYFLKQMAAIVATSPQYVQTSAVLQRFKPKIEVIPIGLEKSTYPKASAEKLAYWRHQFGEQFFLFVGVMRYYKGLPILLDACQNTALPVVIVGSGPMENQLREQAQRLNLKNVHFLGAISDADKVALLELCLAVIFPSHLRSEAFGVSLLEGAMFGKPLISTEIGTGTCYINIHSETGLVVPPENPQALRRAMQWMVDHPEEARAMGDRAQGRYRDYFTAKRMGESYFKLYQKVKSKE